MIAPRDIETIRFNALRNALYHTARRRSLEFLNRLFNFFVVALGAAAVADLYPDHEFGKWVGGGVALVGALQLVFDFSGVARTHQSLQKDYYSMLAEIEEDAACDEDACRKWEGKMQRIAADEPPTFRGADAKAYNDALGALDWDGADNERLEIPWYWVMVANLHTLDGVQFEKRSERRARLERTRRRWKVAARRTAAAFSSARHVFSRKSR